MASSQIQIKKVALAGLLIAVGIILSPWSIPIGASRCFPIQHAVNVLAGVLLGPWYGCGMAFVTSTIRVMMGTGTLLAYPGSMCGALLCGLLYQKLGRHLPLAFVGEAFGTGILGGILCYPVATLLMGKEAAVFAYVIPFLTASAVGAAMSTVLLLALKKSGALRWMERSLQS